MEGVLKGYDSMVNLVLDECIEYIRNPEDPSQRLTSSDGSGEYVRELGIVVCRGTAITYIHPLNGSEIIENPFLKQSE